MIEIRLLTYFLAIAREQSITKAAESLHISQPTLSKQMLDLEEQLGKQLMVRGRKKITLTVEGDYLRKCAQEIINLMEKTESAFQDNTYPISGDIYLTSGETSILEFITKIFKEIQIEHPNVHFHIHSGDSDTIIERLEKGLADLGLIHGLNHDERYDYVKLPVEDSFGILMPSNCVLANKEFITKNDILDLPLIFPSQAYNGGQPLEWFGTDNQSLNIVATYNLIYNATFMVEQGMGYAFSLGNLVDTSGARDLVFRPFEPEIKVPLFIVTKKHQIFSPAVKLFMKQLNKKLQSLSEL